MQAYGEQTDRTRHDARAVAQRQPGDPAAAPFEDRPDAVALRRLQETANRGPRTGEVTALQRMLNDSPRALDAARPVQLMNDGGGEDESIVLDERRQEDVEEAEDVSGQRLPSQDIALDPPAPVQADAIRVPNQLRVEAGQKTTSDVILLHDGVELCRVANMTKAKVTETLKKLTNGGTAPAKGRAKDYAIKGGAGIVGTPMEHSYDAYEKNEKRNLEQAASAQQRVNAGEQSQVPSQQAFYDRLEALKRNQKGGKKTGHPSISMTKIKLDAPFTLRVGGQDRDITHLYTQRGNGTEMRCYLGNAQGAYQRVHTSMTMDDERSSHTMVQTGEEVTVPQIKQGGRRVGFDSREGAQPGFADRRWSVRSARQTKVKDWIEADEYDQLSLDQRKGSRLLADRFNAVLDQVSSQLMTGKAEDRQVTGIDPSFEILDDSWLFDGDRPATPAAEMEDEAQRLA